jgi:hypothetical protein
MQLLQPMMALEVVVEDADVGAVLNDLRLHLFGRSRHLDRCD